MPLPVPPCPLRELKPDKSAVLSPPVSPCPPVSLKENDSGSVSLGSNPSPAATRSTRFRGIQLNTLDKGKSSSRARYRPFSEDIDLVVDRPESRVDTFTA